MGADGIGDRKRLDIAEQRRRRWSRLSFLGEAGTPGRRGRAGAKGATRRGAVDALIGEAAAGDRSAGLRGRGDSGLLTSLCATLVEIPVEGIPLICVSLRGKDLLEGGAGGGRRLLRRAPWILRRSPLRFGGEPRRAWGPDILKPSGGHGPGVRTRGFRSRGSIGRGQFDCLGQWCPLGSSGGGRSSGFIAECGSSASRIGRRCKIFGGGLNWLMSTPSIVGISLNRLGSERSNPGLLERAIRETGHWAATRQAAPSRCRTLRRWDLRGVSAEAPEVARGGASLVRRDGGRWSGFSRWDR